MAAMTDTPDMSRTALEALAERLARYSVRESNALEDDLLQAAATLRALVARVIELEVERLQAIAARAEPPSDVAKPRTFWAIERAPGVAPHYYPARQPSWLRRGVGGPWTTIIDNALHFASAAEAQAKLEADGWHQDPDAGVRVTEHAYVQIPREPPAEEGAKPRMEQSDNVAALVEEARQYAGKATRSADAYRDARLRFEAETHANFSNLVSRLTAALTAQVERAERAEEARRIAALETPNAD